MYGAAMGNVPPPPPPWEPRDGAYVYEQVADHIEERIRIGNLPVGARLPGEEDLAEEYGVAYTTVRRAMRVLRERGLVYTLPAKGSYVKAQERESEPPAD